MYCISQILGLAALAWPCSQFPSGLVTAGTLQALGPGRLCSPRTNSVREKRTSFPHPWIYLKASWSLWLELPFGYQFTWPGTRQNDFGSGQIIAGLDHLGGTGPCRSCSHCHPSLDLQAADRSFWRLTHHCCISCQAFGPPLLLFGDLAGNAGPAFSVARYFAKLPCCYIAPQWRLVSGINFYTTQFQCIWKFKRSRLLLPLSCPSSSVRITGGCDEEYPHFVGVSSSYKCPDTRGFPFHRLQQQIFNMIVIHRRQGGSLRFQTILLYP